MVEARARAKAQMGAETTGLELEGNNPIKFARSPDQALAQLLNPPEPGFMEADRAVEDAFLDLQSHQVATLKAIPGALRATLDRFSPGSIRRRRGGDLGLLAKLLPAFRDAALWRHYEREFVAVKKESDEAFMEVFAKEFRKAYERQLREGMNAGRSSPCLPSPPGSASRLTDSYQTISALQPPGAGGRRGSGRASPARARRCRARAAPRSNGPRPEISSEARPAVMIGIDVDAEAAIALAADRPAADRLGEHLLELGAAPQQQGDPPRGLDAEQGDVAARVAEIEIEQRVRGSAARHIAPSCCSTIS